MVEGMDHAKTRRHLRVWGWGVGRGYMRFSRAMGRSVRSGRRTRPLKDAGFLLRARESQTVRVGVPLGR